MATAPAPPKALPRARTALSVAILAVLYLWVFPYHAVVNNPNENVRIFMTVAIVDDGTFAINRIENTWGYTNDKAVRDTPLSEAILQRHISDDVLRVAGIPDEVLERFRRHQQTPDDLKLKVHLLYSSKAPGTSYLGVPAYWLFTRLTHRDSRPVPPPPPPPTPPPPPEGAPRPALVLPTLDAPVVLGAPGTPPPPRPPVVAAPVRRPEVREPIDRTKAVYVIRLFANVIPGLLFAWFWHRFLARRTRSAALREAVFFSTMAGSSLYAYSEVFASHAHNAFCLAASMMALAEQRQRDVLDRAEGRTPGFQFMLSLLAGMFGAGCALFEYPAAIASAVMALWILASAAERRRALLLVAGLALGVGALALTKHNHKKGAAVCVALALAAYGGTLSHRSATRLVAAGLGAIPPMALAMLYHKRAFGDALKTGYSFLENAQFRSEISQGFFGATAFSWEAGLRLWFDPGFGLVPSTFVFAVSAFGVGALLAWNPDGNLLPASSPVNVSRRLAVRGFFGALTLVALVKFGKAAQAHAVNLAHADVGSWLVALSVASIGLFSVTLPPPTRRDRSMGAAILLCCLGMSFLIGMMNNWRGGWQVGPRYLVTLIPPLAIAALAALDALYTRFEDVPLARRALTVFAAGSTACAFLVTGLVSAWFPHVPVEFVAPFYEMLLPILRSGLVPRNAGQVLFHQQGMASMWGFALAALATAALVLRGDERRPLAAIAHACASLALAVVLLIPPAAVLHPETAPVTRYVRTAFEPRPPDAPQPNVAPPPNETRAQASARARRLMEVGDTPGAWDAWLRAVRAQR